MKILYRFLFILGLIGAAASCGDPDLPFETFDDVQYGAYPRTLSSDGFFNFFDLENSNVTYTVEFYDEAQGQNVESYTWTVEYVSKGGNNGVDVAPVAFKSFSKSDFVTNENGLPGLTFSLNASEALSALGLTKDDVDGGDIIRFDGMITKTNGSTFGFGNTGTNVLNNASWLALFRSDQALICPSELAGEFTFTTTDIVAGAGGDAAACGGSTTGTVELVATSTPGVYDLLDPSFGQFACAWNDSEPNAVGSSGNVQLIDACGNLSFVGEDKYGDTYTISIVSNTGSELTFNWTNSYGDGGTTTLSRSGFTWPSDLKTE